MEHENLKDLYNKIGNLLQSENESLDTCVNALVLCTCAAFGQIPNSERYIDEFLDELREKLIESINYQKENPCTHKDKEYSTVEVTFTEGKGWSLSDKKNEDDK